MKLLAGIIGVLLLVPLSISYGFVLEAELVSIEWLTSPMKWFAGGFIIYLIIHLLFARPIILNIFEHEIIHSIWSLLMGGKFQSIYISKTHGGYSSSTRTNFLILLAPYFFPFYSLLFLTVYFIASTTFKPYILFCIGFTLSFHLVFTAYSIWEGQSDIRKVGFIFSIILIVFMNIVLIGLLISSILPDYNAKYFLSQGIINCFNILKQYFRF